MATEIPKSTFYPTGELNVKTCTHQNFTFNTLKTKWQLKLTQTVTITNLIATKINYPLLPNIQ